MKPDPQTLSFPDESVVVENYLENYQLCHLIRDQSWPMQEPDIDPFTHQTLDLDISVFDANRNNTPAPAVENGSAPIIASAPATWNVKSEQIDVPNPAWQVAPRHHHNDTKLRGNCSNGSSRSHGSSSSTTLTPVFSAMEFPKIERPRTLHLSQTYGTGGGGRDFRSPKDKITIGIYTRAERDAKILRFREKRLRRNFTKRVLYGCRKRFADSRPRVGGRFVMNENRVIKPRTFLKRGRPRKVAVFSLNCLAASLLTN